jgi:hypothetical protein
VGAPDTLDSYSKYGLSYLIDVDCTYLLAAKFSNLLNSLGVDRSLSLRLFNVFLLFILVVLAFGNGKHGQLFAVLLLTPQVWYVFSYFNNDALALFLSMLLGYQFAVKDSWLNQYVMHAAGGGYFLRGGFISAFLIGLLSISKTNYAPFIAFLLLLAVWNIYKIPAARRKAPMLKYAWVLGLGFCIFSVQHGYDLAVNGMNKDEKVLNLAERLAAEEFKPSKAATPSSFYGLRLREKGFSYWNLFTRHQWHVTTFKSFFGVYGWMTIFAGKLYYLGVFILSSLFALFILWISLTRARGPDRLPVITTVLLMISVILLSTIYSWIIDLQAQGRYLFPMLGMIAVLLYRSSTQKDAVILHLFTLTFFLVSIYSFIFVGLVRMPMSCWW